MNSPSLSDTAGSCIGPKSYQNHEEPIRIALLGGTAKCIDLLTYLERIPGIEIVGMMCPERPHQPAKELRNPPCRVWESLEDLVQQASPQVLLDFSRGNNTPTPEKPTPPENIDIVNHHSATLFWKLVKYEQNAQCHMAQIEKLANIGTLASGIFHDINNPLYVILGLSELLLDETIPPSIREPVLEVLQATKRIITMCQELNLYARQGTPKPCVPVNVQQQLEEALKVAKFASGLENIIIRRNYSQDVNILAKPDEIIQIFVNLIMNALQAMNGQGTLSLQVEATQDRAWITIEDTGPGIPPELIERIFEPFFTTKPPGKGTGLGLHSVRSLIHKYAGDVRVTSVPKKGTMFHLDFPIGHEQLPAALP